MTSQEPPPRVVVRSTDVPSRAPAAARGAAPDAGEEAPSGVVREGPGEAPGPDGGSEPAAVYARSLARAQLRLALACVVSFLAVVALLTVTMSAVPTLGDVHLLGVPLPWLLHAYGFYPVIAAFALVFALAAARNERRFRALVEDE
ncbi:heavy metal transporter [Oerskovia rustica]|uniref:Heavy metal transporter n=1 Tax=Oerskovia rustica TaxID=2762237 RepID=A0ABR8RTD1_9CELL|nr:heavy metal transporter [Oerskovia rustica]MBD7950662.1 heavy metal transporter [Oerskovia rustica]